MPSALGGLPVDNQLKLIRLLEGEVSRMGAAQDFVDDGCNSTGPIGLVVRERDEDHGQSAASVQP